MTNFELMKSDVLGRIETKYNELKKVIEGMNEKEFAEFLENSYIFLDGVNIETWFKNDLITKILDIHRSTCEFCAYKQSECEDKICEVGIEKYLEQEVKQ